MRKILFGIVAFILVLVANAQVALATGSFSYQPTLPKELEKLE